MANRMFDNLIPYSDLHEMNLDWIINKVKEYIEKTNKLEINFDDLKNYVDNYFDNLDVQNEINNKLDEMYESGELSDIIQEYLQVSSLLTYNTIADLKNAENLIDGVDALCLGLNNYLDGNLNYFKIRTLTSSDVIDETNIFALTNYPTLIAEKLIIKRGSLKIYNPIRYYVDNTNGDDLNDGLSEQTAFKTLNKVLELSQYQNDLRIYLINSGDYIWNLGNNSSCFNFHIISNVDDVNLIFDNTENAMSFYQSHIALVSQSTNKMNITILNAENDLYFDNCLLTLTNVNVDSQLRMYGGQLMSSNCNYKQIVLRNVIGYFADGTHITNIKNNVSPFSFTNSKISMTGAFTGEELEADGTTPFLTASFSDLFIGSVIVPNNSTHKYGYGLRLLNNSKLGINCSRETQCGSRTINGNELNCNTSHYCVLYTDRGIQSVCNVRYYNNVLAYYDGTTWQRVS